MWRILCYHAIPDRSVKQFGEQLRWLKSNGFRFCTVADGVRRRLAMDTDRWLSISFDDGDATVVSNALRQLQIHAIPATLYLTSDYVCSGKVYHASVSSRALSWNQIAEWVVAGYEVGSHTHTHARLSECKPQQIEYEVSVSKQMIEDKLGIEAESFAFPWGQYSAPVVYQIQALGLYRSLATIDRGTMRQFGTLLRRDLIEPNWSLLQVYAYLLWGDSLLYGMHRTLARKTVEMPEEQPASQA
jgi:peptidoglycan/xylan/chitin deacetylase (PgdA/CDA1 family)